MDTICIYVHRSMPITVGLFAKWGSGKSFLLGKLRQEMTAFTREWIEPHRFYSSPLFFFLLLQVASLTGVVAWAVSYMADSGNDYSTILGLVLPLIIVVFSYLCVIGLSRSSYRYK
jgi:ankyrin repeat-rich membrane spanning protein